jgi:hypothetical protein
MVTFSSARFANYTQRPNWAKLDTYEQLMKDLNQREPHTALNHISVNRAKKRGVGLNSYEILMREFNKNNKPHNGLDHRDHVSPNFYD